MVASTGSFNDLIGRKAILGWVSYPPTDHNNFCYLYPEWVQKNGGMVSVESSAVPDRGCIFVSIQDGGTAAGIRRKYGELVVATINASNIENTRYPNEQDRYYAMLNERMSNSAIEFSSLSEHSLGRELFQVVELDEDEGISLDAPFSRPVTLRQECVYTSRVMVEKVQGTKLTYYGPFNLAPVSSGEYVLSASADYRNMIHRIDSSEVGDVVSVSRQYDHFGTVARFITRPAIAKILNKPTGPTAIDWVSDEELIDAVASIIKATRNLKVKPEDLRALRKAIQTCTMETAKIYVTDDRKRRMEELLSQPEVWEEKLDILAFALARPESSEKLMELALDPEHFPKVKSMFVDNEDIQRQVDAERRRFETEAEQARKKAKELSELKAAAERELEEKRRDLEKMKEDALADVRGQLDALTDELEAKRSELDTTEKGLELLELKAESLVGRLNMTVDDVVADLSRNRVIRMLSGTGVESGFASANASDAPVSSAPIYRSPRRDEAGMSAADVVSALHAQISGRAGRGMDELEVANLLTCLMGSEITVFSGLPGTGKTSLATLLAGALGLDHGDAPRFTKIPVERGWASHRDYIGYYNPLSKTLEASNADVFDAMVALDAECRAAGTASGATEGSVPYLFLLDEANLSVVENYWAPFLGNADDFMVKPVSLSMQGGTSLRIPANVRWIATVNYDHTTEALSDRFLNRAWVINMAAESLSLDDLFDSPDSCDFSDVEPFSYAKLLDVFGPKEEARIEEQMARKLLVSVFERCADAGHPVSYRCQRAIARYVATAEPLFGAFTGSAAIRAVDFAVAQRVLPSINGIGNGVRSMLDSIAHVSPALECTNACVARMLQAGDSDGFYQFFA